MSLDKITLTEDAARSISRAIGNFLYDAILASSITLTLLTYGVDIANKHYDNTISKRSSQEQTIQPGQRNRSIPKEYHLSEEQIQASRSFISFSRTLGYFGIGFGVGGTRVRKKMRKGTL